MRHMLFCDSIATWWMNYVFAYAKQIVLKMSLILYHNGLNTISSIEMLVWANILADLYIAFLFQLQLGAMDN